MAWWFYIKLLLKFPYFYVNLKYNFSGNSNHVWMSNWFFRFVKFTIIVLNRFSMTLVPFSALFSLLWVLEFNLLMVSQTSWMVCLHLCYFPVCWYLNVLFHCPCPVSLMFYLVMAIGDSFQYGFHLVPWVFHSQHFYFNGKISLYLLSFPFALLTYSLWWFSPLYAVDFPVQ